MKTIGRILIILLVFSALSGLMVLAVNASGSTSSGFDGAPSQLRPQGDGDQFRPEGDQNRPERGGREGLGGGSRWMFGLVKNMVVLTVLVTIIALPRSLAKKKRKKAAVSSVNDQV